MQHDDHFYFLRGAQVARQALARGDDGFASLLVGPDGAILLERGNEASTTQNPMNHDTILLLQDAVARYDRAFLSQCTLYAIMEPCAMCMGAAFWAGVDHIKFAMSERELGAMLPGGLDIPSTELAARSPRPVTSQGPFPQEADAYQVVRDWVRSLGVPVQA